MRRHVAVLGALVIASLAAGGGGAPAAPPAGRSAFTLFAVTNLVLSGNRVQCNINSTGEWCVDGPANNGPGWDRTGDPTAVPPTVTATPSIQCRSYHGWLRDGKLVP